MLKKEMLAQVRARRKMFEEYLRDIKRRKKAL